MAENHVKEDDWIFQEFYRSVNRIVHKQHEYRLMTLVRVMRDEAVVKEAGEFLQKLRDELDNSDPEVRMAVESFYRAILEIVVDNSLLIRLMLKYRKVMRPVVAYWRRLLRAIAVNLWLKPIVEPRIMVFEAYDSSNSALEHMTPAT